MLTANILSYCHKTSKAYQARTKHTGFMGRYITELTGTLTDQRTSSRFD